MVYYCGTCRLRFPGGWHARQQHLEDFGHQAPAFECDSCDRICASQNAIEQHMDALNHWADESYNLSSNESSENEYQPYFPSETKNQGSCEECSLLFAKEEDFDLHNEVFHSYCASCDRTFSNYDSLTQHLESSIHRPIPGLQCPFCKQYKTNATNLVHHMEDGRCPRSRLNRYLLFQAVQDRDPNRTITLKYIQTEAATTVYYVATEHTYNRRARAYECYICHRHFYSLNGLNSHLNSPIHQENIYHCPNRRCGREFTILAGLMSHLESGSCCYMGFGDVQRQVMHIIDPRRMIEL